MKSRTIILTLTVPGSVLLAECSDDHYSVSHEYCKPEHWQQLPDNSDRVALIEKCMT